MVPQITYNDVTLECVPDLDTALQTCDCCIIVTDHTVYDWRHIRQQAALLVDTRHVIRDQIQQEELAL
jgi:UDP-N-acetyl-D-mannosaminuronate dehydrogenase